MPSPRHAPWRPTTGCRRRGSTTTTGPRNEEWGAVLAVREDGFEELEDRFEVESMLSRLRPREQAIVFLRFYRSMTQVEIADELGLSQVHVSRLLRHALARLR